MSETIAKLDRAKPDFLPDFSDKGELFVASDYAGHHPDREARYEVYSFLICDYHGSSIWKRQRLHVRDTQLRERTMSFKGLHDHVKRRALPAFLAAANEIEGVLVAIAISKAFRSLFRRDAPLDMHGDELKPYCHWQPSTFEKLLRAVHFVSFLLGGLSHPEQRILWYSDDDDIAPNASHSDRTRTSELGDIFCLVLPNYVPHRIPRVVIGTEKDDEPTWSLRDILAVPDLACGSWCRFLSLVSGQAFGHGTDEVDKALVRSKAHALELLRWFAEDGLPLKRLLCIIEPPDSNGRVEHLCSAPFTLSEFQQQVSQELARRAAG